MYLSTVLLPVTVVPGGGKDGEFCICPLQDKQCCNVGVMHTERGN